MGNPPPGGSKKKKGRAPKHQNSYAFRHNPKSKKTDKILSSPNVGVCRRCSEKIEWRKKYRKYKPRSQPGKCNLCSQKNVLAAYHTICAKCVTSDRAIIAMEEHSGRSTSTSTASAFAALTLETSLPPSIDDEGHDEEENTTESSPSAPANADNTVTTLPRRRKIRVCAICAHEPALSKYAEAGVDGDLVVAIQELEETLEAGRRPGDERRLTLREKKSVQRKIEKLQRDLRRAQNNDEEEGTRDGDGSDDGGEEERGEDCAEVGDPESNLAAQGDETEDDPFLMATGGKALVGEDYQQMLLAREQTVTSTNKKAC